MADTWQPLADRNPVPGDPDAVAQLGFQLRATANTIRVQLERLHSINSEEFWSGVAAERFKEHQEELHQPLEQQAERHQRVGDALVAYAPGLGEAQRQSRTALAQAREAQTAITRAQNGVEDMENQRRQAQAAADEWSATNPDAPPRQPDQWWGPNWQGELESANANLAAARRLLEDAVELRDRAADRCADTIGEAIHDGLRNHHGLFHAISRAAHAIASLPVVKVVTEVVAVAAAVVGVVAIVCPILAPLAIGLGVAALALDSLAAIGGDGSWRMVATDAFGLATMGVGRAFEGAARATATGARMSQGLRAEATALEATQGMKGALKGVSVVTEEGKTLYGAAARSARLKQLATATEEAEHGLPRFVPKAANWREAFSPRQIRTETFRDLGEVHREGARAFSGSVREFGESMGMGAEPWQATRLGQQAVGLKTVDFAAETIGADRVARDVHRELSGAHADEAAERRGETVVPIGTE